MTDQQDRDLSPAKRRRLIIGAVLRGLLVTTVLVVLYYLLPQDQPWDTGTAVRLLIGLLVLAGPAGSERVRNGSDRLPRDPRIRLRH